MRVAVIVPGGVDPSGTVRVIPCLLWLLERLACHHDVHVYALWQSADQRHYSLAGAEVYAAGPRWGRARSILQLIRTHLRDPFDVLHAFWVPPAAVGSLMGKLLRRPVIVHLAGGELVAMPEIGYGGLCSAAGRWQARVALAGASVVTASSSRMLAAVADFGYTAERVVLGVDLRRWPPRPPRPREGKTATLVHVGSLNRVKDQETLVRAMRFVRDRGATFRLHMIGEDTLGGQIQRTVLDAGLQDAVTFHGFKPNEELRLLLERADLLVMSSRHEAAEMVTLEAAAVGVPAVGTATGRIGEWAPAEAVAVQVGDHEALGKAIHRLLTDEPSRLAIAHAAHRRALREDADATADRIMALYEHVTGKAA